MLNKFVPSLNILFLSFFLTISNSSLYASSNNTLETIQKRKVLKVGLEVGYVPFEMKDTKGRIIGLDIDMAELIAREMEVKLEIINTEWDGIIPSLLTGKFDMIISGMTLTQGRNLKVNFADPYVEIGQTVLLRKTLADKIKSYRDLNNGKFKVGSKLGTSGEIAAKKYIPNAEYSAYQTEQEAVLDLTRGQIDAFIYDYPYNFVISGGKYKDKVTFIPEKFTYEPLAFAVNKGDADFLNWLNHFLRQIKRDGRFDRIQKRWLENQSWLKNIQQ